jgi:hypothetical protein
MDSRLDDFKEEVRHAIGLKSSPPPMARYLAKILYCQKGRKKVGMIFKS